MTGRVLLCLLMIMLENEAFSQSVKHSLRVQARGNIDGNDTEGLQASYFSRWGELAVFANITNVTKEAHSDHREHELNLGYPILSQNDFLKHVLLSVRNQKDVFGHNNALGLQWNLTRYEWVSEKLYSPSFNVFVQWYPVKDSDHNGDQDVFLYYQIPIWGQRLTLRGSKTVAIFNNESDVETGIADLIFAMGKWDIFYRYADSVDPTTDGNFVGIRYLLNF